MPKQLLNEAELLLLHHWDEAYSLQKSMERVREKYAAIFEQAAEAVTKAHPELDSHKTFVTQLWSDGSIGFGRKSWPEGDSSGLPGFWLGNLRLEKLAAEDEPPPVATVWIAPKLLKKIGVETATARQRLLADARTLLSETEFSTHIQMDCEGNALLCFRMISKKDVLDLFVAGDGGGLVEALVTQFDLMSRFVPSIDRLLSEKPPA